MPITRKKKIGNLGEECAIKFLKKNKYKIIEQNFSNKYGEIDVICENKEFIVFVEVKTRTKNSIVSGVYAVNKKKRYNIIKTAHTYLKAYPSKKQPRFDIIEVEHNKDNGDVYIKEHYVNAFIQGGEYGVF